MTRKQISRDSRNAILNFVTSRMSDGVSVSSDQMLQEVQEEFDGKITYTDDTPAPTAEVTTKRLVQWRANAGRRKSKEPPKPAAGRGALPASPAETIKQAQALAIKDLAEMKKRLAQEQEACEQRIAETAEAMNISVQDLAARVEAELS